MLVSIIVLSVIPGVDTGSSKEFVWLIKKVPSLIQNVMHFVVYGMLCTLVATSLGFDRPESGRWRVAFWFCLALGVLLEWYQTGVPGRYGSSLDVLLNTTGSATALLVASALSRSRRTESRQ